ncbi:unnamed protein product, partial [Phaeothamnion confervicola]
APRPLAIKHIRLGEINVLASYEGQLWMNLESFKDVHLKIHPLVYTNKTWTARKLFRRVRRDVALDVLSQVQRNFNNLGLFLTSR